MSTYDNFGQFRGFGGLSNMSMPMYMPMRQSEGLFNQFQSFLMNNPLMSTVLGGAGSLIGTGLNFLGQRMQNSWNERMWNEMNEYNTPDAQIQRFLDAGINPAAAVASVTGTPNMTTEAMTGPSSAVAQGDIGELFGNAQIRGASSEAAQAQADLASAQEELVKKQTDAQSITNKWLNAKEMQNLKNLYNEGRISESTANMLAVDEYYKGPEAAGHYMQTVLTINKMSQEISNLQAQYYNELADTKMKLTQAGLNEALIAKAFSDIGLNNAQIEHLDHLNTYYDASAAAQWQNVTESQARTMLMNISAAYEAKLNEIFFNGGPDLRSDTNANLTYAIHSGNTALAKEICNGLGAMVMAQGDARSKSPDYNMDKAIDLIGNAMHMFGFMNLGGNSHSVTTTRNIKNVFNPLTGKYEEVPGDITITESRGSNWR